MVDETVPVLAVVANAKSMNDPVCAGGVRGAEPPPEPPRLNSELGHMPDTQPLNCALANPYKENIKIKDKNIFFIKYYQ